MADQYVSNLKLTNPYAFTAEDSLNFFYKYGDEHVKKMILQLGYSVPTQKLNEPFDILKKAVSIYKEIRYRASNVLYTKLKDYKFIDLGCGFTPRALWMNHIHQEYVGADFSFIIKKMAPAFKKLLPKTFGKSIRFVVTDVTNPITMMQASGKSTNPLFISTEGLLMYLTDPELKTLMENINIVLSKHTGYWVTMDLDIRSFTLAILKKLCGDDLSHFEEALKNHKRKSDNFLTQYKSFKVYENHLYKDADHLNFFRENNFAFTATPIASLIDHLNTLNDVPDEIQKGIFDLLENQYIYTLMPKSAIQRNTHVFNNNFSTEFHISFHQMNIKISGRLDTLTADDLLNKFNKYKEKLSYDTICINCSELDYISSAGLRVLMIMCKTVHNKRRFFLTNCNKTVQSVLKESEMDPFISFNSY